MFYLPKLHAKPRAQAILVSFLVYFFALLFFAALAGPDRQCYDSAKGITVTCTYGQQVSQNVLAIFYGAAIFCVPFLALFIAYVVKKIQRDPKPVISDSLFYTLLTIYTVLTLIGLGLLMLGPAGSD